MVKRLALLAPLVAAGCLSGPTGLAPVDAGGDDDDDAAAIDAAGIDAFSPDANDFTWPVAGETVTAAAAGDLDNDGTDQLVLTTETYVYLFDELPSTGVPTAWLARQPLTTDTRTTIALVNTDGGAGLDIVVVHVADEDTVASVFDGADLEPLQTHDIDTNTPAVGTPMWTRAVMFPGSNARLLIGLGAGVKHAGVPSLSTSSLDINIVPGTTAGMWDTAMLGFTYNSGGDFIVIADRDTVQRGTHPPPNFTWTETRANPEWLGQVDRDLTTDGISEVIGYQTGTPNRICADQVINTDAAICADITLPHNAGVRMLIDTFTTPGGPDLVVSRDTGSGTVLDLLPDLSLNTGTSTLTIGTALNANVPVEDAFVIAADTGQANKSVLVIGANGTIQCRRESPGSFPACT